MESAERPRLWRWRAFCAIYTISVLVICLTVHDPNRPAGVPIFPIYYFFTIQTLILTILHYTWSAVSAVPAIARHVPRVLGPQSCVVRILFATALVDMTMVVAITQLFLPMSWAHETRAERLLCFKQASYHGVHLAFLAVDLLADRGLARALRMADAFAPVAHAAAYILFMRGVHERTGLWIYPVMEGKASAVRLLLQFVPISSAAFFNVYFMAARLVHRRRARLK